MANQTIVLAAKGWRTSLNPFTEDGDGALTQADNVVINKPGVIEPRPAFPTYASAAIGTLQQIYSYQRVLLMHDGTWLYRMSGTSFVPTVTASALAVSTAILNPRIKSAQASKNLYLATASGLLKTDAATTAPYAAGVSKGLDLTLSSSGTTGTVLTGSSTATGGAQVGYRCIWFYKDANANLVRGAPSQRAVYTNTPASIAAGGLSRAAGTTVTATTSAAHGYSTGDTVHVYAGTADANFATGNFTITVTGGTTFTYAQSGSNVTSTTAYTATKLRNVQVIATIPSAVSTSSQSYYLQVYRTPQSQDYTTDPGDEMGLVYEVAKPAASTSSSFTRAAGTTVTVTTAAAHGLVVGQTVNIGTGGANFVSGYKVITAVGTTTTFSYAESGSNVTESHSWTVTPVTVVVTDIAPDSLRGASLYTNPSQQGILRSNETAPLAYDIAAFKNCLFFANTTGKYRLSLSLLSAVSGTGVTSGDTVTIGGQTYTAAGTESIASKQFLVATTGSAAQNIADTAQSLCRCVNQNASNTTIYAYYVSGPTDAPGMMVFEERGIGGSSFAATASAHGTAWSPNLPTSGTTVSSVADRFKNGLFYSKQSEPEAVPLTNFFFVGEGDKEIVRVVPLRDALIVLKEDGTYRLTGDDASSFRVDALDRSAICTQTESPAVLENSVFCLGTQGVMRITESGVALLTAGIIDDDIGPYAAPNVANPLFGVANAISHRYILKDGSQSLAFVYSTATGTWVRWYPFLGSNNQCALTHVDGLTYFGDAGGIRQQQSFDSAGYRNESSQSVNATIVSGNTVTIDVSVGASAIGARLVIGSQASIVIATPGNSNVLTMCDSAITGTGAGTLAFPTTYTVQWAQQACGVPFALKNMSEAGILFARTNLTVFSLSFTSDTDPSASVVSVDGTAASVATHSTLSYVGPRAVRVPIPQEKRRAAVLSVTWSTTRAYADFQLDGIAISNDLTSAKVSR